jgi:hypothetical protein
MLNDYIIDCLLFVDLAIGVWCLVAQDQASKINA